MGNIIFFFKEKIRKEKFKKTEGQIYLELKYDVKWSFLFQKIIKSFLRRKKI